MPAKAMGLAPPQIISYLIIFSTNCEYFMIFSQ